MKRYFYQHDRDLGYEIFDRTQSHVSSIARTWSRDIAEKICKALNDAN